MAKKKGIKITYPSGATKTVYLENIQNGTSLDPRDYATEEWKKRNMGARIEEIEEGDF